MLRDWPRPLDPRQQYRLFRPSWPSGKSGDCPRHGDIDNRAEEQEQRKREWAALHLVVPAQRHVLKDDLAIPDPRDSQGLAGSSLTGAQDHIDLIP